MPLERSTALLLVAASTATAQSLASDYANSCKVAGSAELWTIADGAHLPELSEHFTPLVAEWQLGHPKRQRFPREVSVWWRCFVGH